MKKFYFHLNKYRNFKLQEEKMAQLEFAMARKAFQEETAKLAAIQKKTSELFDINRKLLCGNIQRELLDACYGCLQVQQNALAEQAAVVLKAEEKMQREQKVYLEARKTSKLLERLYQREWTAYYQEFLRVEQKTLDEIGLLSYVRN
ncbi:MAG: flagellar FliJ family protein [Syntrophaceticus sp.]